MEVEVNEDAGSALSGIRYVRDGRPSVQSVSKVLIPGQFFGAMNHLRPPRRTRDVGHRMGRRWVHEPPRILRIARWLAAEA